jgi:hypothetical protein
MLVDVKLNLANLKNKITKCTVVDSNPNDVATTGLILVQIEIE